MLPIPLLAPEYLHSLPAPKTPLHPLLAPNIPIPPRRPQMPLMLPIALLAPEYLHSLSAHPYTLTPPSWPPTPLGDPNAPLCYLYPFWLSIVITLQLTVCMQLECSFSIIRSFICNMKRPSVKQSIKQQVRSNFQIYLGKSDDGAPF